MAYIRTFICFELPERIKKDVAHLQTSLKALGRGVRWSNPEGIHLTLKFLGDVEAARLNDVTNAARSAVRHTAPFQIELTGTGAFANFARPRVYWIGIREPRGSLIKIQQHLEDELADLGFAKETRAFSPHLTIGRVKSPDGLNKISAALQNIKLPQMTFLASDIIVMQSELRPGGARYTPLSTVKLLP